MEAIDFSDLLDEFQALNTGIFGISRDNCLCHGDFRDKHGLTILLLADIDGVLSESMMYGGKRGPW
ncbi:MAG: redoxin domain-containing protein [Sedimenticolaceae bacterium]|uniref:redoxin domain-containing protein n=1 Tax=Candidatus Vondammii sp. HM_W22 TaxID=2687299 RepID=UPI002A4E2C72|nr:redoxin domain-containing protein [Candidatus Vondammii sp. HM_W22]